MIIARIIVIRYYLSYYPWEIEQNFNNSRNNTTNEILLLLRSPVRSPSSCLSSPLENDWAPSSFRFPSLFLSAPTDHGNHPVENGQTFSGAATQSRGLMWNRFQDSHSCHGHRTRTPVRILIDGPCEGPDLLPLQWLLTTFVTDSIWSVLSSSSDRSGCAA